MARGQRAEKLLVGWDAAGVPASAVCLGWMFDESTVVSSGIVGVAAAAAVCARLCHPTCCGGLMPASAPLPLLVLACAVDAMADAGHDSDVQTEAEADAEEGNTENEAAEVASGAQHVMMEAEAEDVRTESDADEVASGTQHGMLEAEAEEAAEDGEDDDVESDEIGEQAFELPVAHPGRCASRSLPCCVAAGR